MAETSIAPKELIVLASPPTGDDYYGEMLDAILDFHVAYATTIKAHDDVLILTDSGGYRRYAEAIGEDHVAVAPMEDIWMRDFTTIDTDGNHLLRYTPAGQGGGYWGRIDANAVRAGFRDVLKAHGFPFADSKLKNDGGNFVTDGDGRAVASRKFLADNRTSEAKARAALISELGLEHVAFIHADEQGGLEHADGVVAFVEPNVLVINSYDEDPAYAAELEADLRAGLPDVSIHKIVTAYDGSDIYDHKFGSACGLYTNMLVTPNRIYLPQFGYPEDETALAQVRALTSKAVIPVQSHPICQMGGGVRCMSWQVRGPDADRLKSSLIEATRSSQR